MRWIHLSIEENDIMTTVTGAIAREGYHHGNLEEVLIASAIAMIEERGVDGLSVREVAKQAGVSPRAPFRHFTNKKALLTAVAEQAMGRLTEAIAQELKAAKDAPPLDQLRAIGRGYLAWAYKNPTHFQVISSRTLIDFNASQKLVDENEAIRVIMVDLIASAQKNDDLRPGVNPDALILSSRATVYGLARMWIDGHFPEWIGSQPAEHAMSAALDLFIGTLGNAPSN